MVIRVQREAFDVGAELAALTAGRADIGALASFVGLVRDHAEAPITAMTLEHYPGMTENAITKIVEEARTRWKILDLAVIHRFG